MDKFKNKIWSEKIRQVLVSPYLNYKYIFNYINILNLINIAHRSL